MSLRAVTGEQNMGGREGRREVEFRLGESMPQKAKKQKGT